MEDAPKQKGRYDRVVHFGDRMRQWTLAEPAIPATTRAALHASCKRLQFNGPLNKESVKDIIIGARQSMRKFYEKWLSIRYLLTGYRTPRPHPNIVESLTTDYEGVSSVWDVVCRERGGRRRSIISVNFIIRNLLLRRGNAEYLRWRDDFPLTEGLEARPDKLMAYWMDVCERLRWPIMVPVETTEI
jgi:hypothetical protein